MRRLGRPSHSFQRTHFLEQLGAPRLDDRELPSGLHGVGQVRIQESRIVLFKHELGEPEPVFVCIGILRIRLAQVTRKFEGLIPVSHLNCL